MMDKDNRIEELESVIRRLVEVDFFVPPESDGDRVCFWCQACLNSGEAHSSSCAYIRALSAIKPPRDPHYFVEEFMGLGEKETNDAPESQPRIGPRSELDENELENRFLKQRFTEMEKEIKELRHTIFVLKCALKAVL